MRHFILLVLCLGFTIAQAQKNFKFGKFSQEEINLTQVDYDPEAVAVYLHDEGHLKITNYGYEITYYVRLKILNPKGFRFATYKHRYIHDSFNDLNWSERIPSILKMENQSSVKLKTETS